MGAYRVDDASRSALARRYCAQGMVLAWSFNAAEAARSFAGALAIDPDCACAAWGQAWALGPNLNTEMQPADAPAVHAALERARALRARAAPRWRELIDALSALHPRPGARETYDAAYAQHMQALAGRRARDADIATLAAEALMSQHPYDWWRPDGRAQPWTPALERLLERALAIDPRHPGANHAWVHLMEGSRAPQRARAAAARLRTLVPGSAHLLHMPAHIDMRLGDYAAASAAGERAIEADRRYLEQVDAQGAYRVAYVAHNHHFLWASASMQGRAARALQAAEQAFAAGCGPRRPERLSGTLQHLLALPLFALVRFGQWQRIASGTRPPDGNEAYPRAMWHYARATALLRLGRAPDAERERAALDETARASELQALRVKNVHAAAALVEIAQRTLEADFALAAGRVDAALSAYRRAVQIEDAFEPDEPHLWLAPTRHALGNALVQVRRFDEAAAVFTQDLRHYPENGWSLAGLAMVERDRERGRTAAAVLVQARLARAWRDADVPLAGARL